MDPRCDELAELVLSLFSDRVEDSTPICAHTHIESPLDKALRIMQEVYQNE